MIVVDSFVGSLSSRPIRSGKIERAEEPQDQILPGRPAPEPDPRSLLAKGAAGPMLADIDFKQDAGRAAEMLTAWLKVYEQRTGREFPRIAQVLRRGEEAAEVHEVVSSPAGIDRLEEFLVQRGTIYRPVRAFQIREDILEPVREKGVPASETFARIPRQIDYGLFTNRISGLAYGEVGYCGVLLRGWIEARDGDHEALMARLSDSDEMLAIHKHLYDSEDKEKALEELSSFARATAEIKSGTMVDHMKLHQLAGKIAGAPADQGVALVAQGLAQESGVEREDAASFLGGSWSRKHGFPEVADALRDGEAAVGFCRLLEETQDPMQTAGSFSEIVRAVGSDHGREAVGIQETLQRRVAGGEERGAVLKELLRGYVAPACRPCGDIGVDDDEVDVAGYRIALRS